MSCLCCWAQRRLAGWASAGVQQKERIDRCVDLRRLCRGTHVVETLRTSTFTPGNALASSSETARADSVVAPIWLDELLRVDSFPKLGLSCADESTDNELNGARFQGVHVAGVAQALRLGRKAATDLQ